MRWLSRRRGEHLETGRAGEAKAARWLRRRGYRILHRNFVTTFGELDIICEKAGVCVFVEVKTRTRAADGRLERDPAESVDTQKRAKLRACARAYLLEFEPIDFPHRFDVVSVVMESGRLNILRHDESVMDPVSMDEGRFEVTELSGWEDV